LWPGGYNACFVPGGPRLKYRSSNCLSCLRFLWSYSAPRGKCYDSTLNLFTTVLFHNLLYSLSVNHSILQYLSKLNPSLNKLKKLKYKIIPRHFLHHLDLGHYFGFLHSTCNDLQFPTPKFVVLTAVLLKIQAFRDGMPCHLVYQHNIPVGLNFQFQCLYEH